MNRLSERLWRACSELGLQVELGFELTLSGGRELTAVALIRHLGAQNGMLIFKSYDEISSVTKELLDAGYGFSVLDEPSPNEEFELDSFKEMFIDWGWSGQLGRKPLWMR